MCQAMPDVCKTPAPPAPPVPIPYPNLGQMAMAVKFSPKVMIENMPVCVEMTEVPMSQGDEAGVAGGVVSGKNMDKIVIKMGSMKVMAGGKKIAMVTSMTAHNGANANMPMGTIVAPSQAKVLVAP